MDVPRKKRVLTKKPEEMVAAKNVPGLKGHRGRPRRKLDESVEGCESGGESDSKNFYFDAAEDEVLEGGSFAGKSTPARALRHSGTSSTTAALATGSRKFDFSSTSGKTTPSAMGNKAADRTSSATDDFKLSWKDSLLDSMAFAYSDDDTKEPATSGGRKREEESEFCFDLGKSSDDERCLEEIPQEMVRELTELRSYNSTLQDMIKDVQQFNSYQRKKRRQWELNKINSGNGSGASMSAATATNGTTTATSSSSATAAPGDALPQWLVSDFSSLSHKMVDLSSDMHHPSSSSSSSSSAHRSEDGEVDYTGAWQQAIAAAAHQPSHTPLHMPSQLAQLAGQPLQFPGLNLNGQHHQSSTEHHQQQGTAPQTGPAPFTTSLPFTEV